MEHSRLLNFSEVSGLVDYAGGDLLPEMLRPHKSLLFAVLAEIEHCMNSLANINGDFEELQPSTDAANVGTDDDLANGFSHVSISYQKTSPEKKHWKGFNHLSRAFDMTANVAKRPKRLKWAAFDKGVFTEFLQRLSTLNSYLEGILRGHQAKMIEDTVHDMYLEMIQWRTSQEELIELLQAAQLFFQPSTRSTARTSPVLRTDDPDRLPNSTSDIVTRANPADRVLASLVHSKSLRVATDTQDGSQPQILEDATRQTEIAYIDIQYIRSSTIQSLPGMRIRNEGTYKPGKPFESDAWIEWRQYRLVSSERHPRKDVPLSKNLIRVKQLVALLQSAKQHEFCTPECLGWFDDRDHGKKYLNPSRFGLVFKKPANGKTPITLSEMINTHSKPSLNDRMLLAHLIARCLLYLHAVNWLHKGLRSDSIIFVPTGNDVDFARPYVTGYDYARPDKDGETSLSTTGESSDTSAQLYVHPDYQGHLAKGNYRKTFDIYSLGIVLLEIVRWKHIREIMDLKADLSEEDITKVKARLLNPENKYMLHLKEDFGKNFGLALQSCLQGREAFGIVQNEKEMEPATGAKLQRAFSEKVVQPLRDIQL